MDAHKSVGDFLMDEAERRFGIQYVSRNGETIYLSKRVFNPLPDFVSFLDDCLNKNKMIYYELQNNKIFGITAIIKLKSGLPIAFVVQC